MLGVEEGETLREGDPDTVEVGLVEKAEDSVTVRVGERDTLEDIEEECVIVGVVVPLLH